MAFLIDQFRFLGLNDNEVRVFTALSTFGQMNVTTIAKRAALPRTTVNSMMPRLVEQGLVNKVDVGKHHEYAVALADVADRLDQLEQRFRPTAREGRGGPATGPQACDDAGQRTVEIAGAAQGGPGSASDLTEGHELMHELVARAFEAHHGERAMVLIAALATPEARMQRLKHCLAAARAADMKLEMLTTTNVTAALSSYARELTALLGSYDLRLDFLPPAFCIERTDVVAFRDLVVVIDHSTDVAERIESAQAVAVIDHLLRVAREAGWGMDMSMWLEGVSRAAQNP
jgi:predicted DNA-binding transcriptional regulator